MKPASMVKPTAAVALGFGLDVDHEIDPNDVHNDGVVALVA